MLVSAANRLRMSFQASTSKVQKRFLKRLSILLKNNISFVTRNTNIDDDDWKGESDLERSLEFTCQQD